jgi:hypothetical protein
VKRILSNYNIFSSFPPAADINIHRNQIIATRLFIFVFNLLMPISTPVIVNSPTYNEYLDLYDKYEQSLECPCSSIAVPYSSFMEINISFHQICSSVYVGSVWPRIIYSSISWQLVKSPFDFRTIGPQIFQIIASFCQLANDSIKNGLISYSSQQLISNNIIQKNIFSRQTNASLDLFLKTMKRYLYYSKFYLLNH